MSDAPTKAAEGEAPKKSGSKLILFIIIGIVALAGAGVGGYFAFAGSSGEDEEQSEEAADEEGEDADAKQDKASKKDAKGKKGKKDNKKSKKPAAPAIYVKLDPALVVNFESQGMMRFLQVGVEISTRDPVVAEELKTHDPVIRNDLLLLLTNQKYEDLSTREGKDKLRADALAAVRTIVENEGGHADKVESVYFTSFVMQ